MELPPWPSPVGCSSAFSSKVYQWDSSSSAISYTGLSEWDVERSGSFGLPRPPSQFAYAVPSEAGCGDLFEIELLSVRSLL